MCGGTPTTLQHFFSIKGRRCNPCPTPNSFDAAFTQTHTLTHPRAHTRRLFYQRTTGWTFFDLTQLHDELKDSPVTVLEVRRKTGNHFNIDCDAWMGLFVFSLVGTRLSPLPPPSTHTHPQPLQADFYHADQLLPQSDEALVARVKRYISQVRVRMDNDGQSSRGRGGKGTTRI